MNEAILAKMTAMATEPEMIEKSTIYLQEHLRTFLKKNEPVMICFSGGEGSFGTIMEEAVNRCGAKAIMAGEDIRWKTILRTSFNSRCSTIVGPPLMLLGLSKLARKMGTPLYIRNAIVAGYPSTPWMLEGIREGLDCIIRGCYDPGAGALIAGFACRDNQGVHLRSDLYDAQIVDSEGRPLPDGEIGQVILSPVGFPEIRLNTGDSGRLARNVCSCGCKSPRIMDLDPNVGVDITLSRLGAEMHHWTSILDCRLAKTGYGLEIELITFPGEKLPRLPSFAKMVVRPWNPEKDEPFSHMFVLKNRLFSEKNH